MLLEFRFSNFRSFKEEAVFSLIPSTQRTLKEVIINDGKARALPSAVIYGANASGKTNVLLAMRLMDEIITNGGIKNKKNSKLLEILPFIPFIHSKEGFCTPIEMEITFFQQGYEITFGINLVLDTEKNNKINFLIDKEYMLVNGAEIYRRVKSHVEINYNDLTKKYFSQGVNTKIIDALRPSLLKDLSEKDLFLSTGFISFSKKIHSLISMWFSEKLSFQFNLDVLTFENNLIGDKEKIIRVRTDLFKKIMKFADFGPQEIEYEIENDGEKKFVSLISKYRLGTNKHFEVDSSIMESHGTMNLMKFVPTLVSTLSSGSVLIVDELDASLHFDLLAGIIRVFQNREINKNGAQLVFCSHNPLLLSKDVFRRDQLYFVSKDEKTFSSELFSLADFKTYGKSGVKSEENYLKNYLNGKYGALPTIDFEKAIYEYFHEKSEGNQNDEKKD